MLIALGAIWFIHFYFGIRWRFLVPSLFIVTGTLMLVARMAIVPEIRKTGATLHSSNPE